MDFDLTEEQKMLKTNVRDFLDNEIAPVVDERDRQGPLTKEEEIGFFKKLMPFGYYHLPEEYGGVSLDAKTRGLLIEELSRVWAGLAGAVFTGASGGMIAVTAPDKIRERYLSRAKAGEVIGAMGITEPNVGSDTRNVETTAVLDGDEYVINGTKTWISNATTADIAIVMAVTDKSKGAAGISAIMVDKEASPFQTRELHKIGWRAFPTGEMIFDDCRVPKENNIALRIAEALGGGGGSAGAYAGMIQGFEVARSMMASMAAGISQAAIDASIKYAQERKQFGRPIGSFQMIQEMIVDMIAETEASRLLAYRAFDLIDKGVRARLESSLAKAYATEAAVGVTSKAIQIHGAMGLSDEYPVERYFRDARMLTIPDGATQIQKLIVGREAIGIRAFT